MGSIVERVETKVARLAAAVTGDRAGLAEHVLHGESARAEAAEAALAKTRPEAAIADEVNARLAQIISALQRSEVAPAPPCQPDAPVGPACREPASSAPGLCPGDPTAPADAGPVPPSPARAAHAERRTPAASREALVSSLIDPFARERIRQGKLHTVVAQERGTLRRFLEACGDRPFKKYGRGDVTSWLELMRRLPVAYGKSPRDK